LSEDLGIYRMSKFDTLMMQHGAKKSEVAYVSEIKKVTPEEASKIIDTRKPLGLFYCIEDGLYIAIDNAYGDAWVEEFKSLSGCRRWLSERNLHQTHIPYDTGGHGERAYREIIREILSGAIPACADSGDYRGEGN